MLNEVEYDNWDQNEAAELLERDSPYPPVNENAKLPEVANSQKKKSAGGVPDRKKEIASGPIEAVEAFEKIYRMGYRMSFPEYDRATQTFKTSVINSFGMGVYDLVVHFRGAVIPIPDVPTIPGAFIRETRLGADVPFPRPWQRESGFPGLSGDIVPPVTQEALRAAEGIRVMEEVKRHVDSTRD